MSKPPLREFPQENPRAPWPQLLVSPEDRHYSPLPETRLGKRWRLLRSSLDVLALDMGAASTKGIFLGFFSFAVTFSFLTLYNQGFCWWVGWHWALGIGGILLLLVLIGVDLTVLIIAAVALFLSFSAMIGHPLILLLFIGGGVLVRCLIELFPRKMA